MQIRRRLQGALLRDLEVSALGLILAKQADLAELRTMFLIRLAFWLGVVVLVLPTDAQQQARVYSTAVSTIERVTTFCDRNARTCTVAGEAWATFLKKAEFGARLLGDLISSGGRQGNPDGSRTPAPNHGAGAGPDRGTLSSADLEPAWRGPSMRRSGA
jgi:hypothetical protein